MWGRGRGGGGEEEGERGEGRRRGRGGRGGGEREGEGYLYYRLAPRPSHCPVFSRVTVEKTEGESLEDLSMSF